MEEETPPTKKRLSYLMTAFTIVVGLVGILAYLNDIGVFTPGFTQEVEEADAPTPCWETDIAYVNDLSEGHNILRGEYNLQESVQNCRKSCKRFRRGACLFWSYDEINKFCYLKSARVTAPLSANGFISGPVGCIVPYTGQQITDMLQEDRDKVNFPSA